MTNEQTRLLVDATNASTVNDAKKKRKQLKRELILNRTLYPISAVVALPTSVLSGLAILQGASGHLGSLKNWDEIAKLIKQQPIDTLLYASLCLLATEVVLTSLNKKYLLGSSKTVVDLIRKDFNWVKSKIQRKELDGLNPSLIENGLFVWCFVTSLIFAEIGKETMSFTGAVGEEIGFYLNLLVYFATRFAGARRFFQGIIEKNDNSDEASEKPPLKDVLRSKLPMIPGYLLALVSAVPIIINFIPESDRGLQTLLHSDLAADAKYQNAGAIAIGIMASLPTVFFYSVSIKDLPKHCVTALTHGYDHLKSKNYKQASLLSLFTLLAFGASYFTSIGFRLVGTSNIEQGYLSYLNEGIRNTMPDALFAAVILMFWSHLQHLANEAFKPQPTTQPTRASQNPNSFYGSMERGEGHARGAQFDSTQPPIIEQNIAPR